MEPTTFTPNTIIVGVSCISAVVVVLRYGMLVQKFKMEHVTNESCDTRFNALKNNMTFMILLLMEITTTDQRDQAKEKAKSLKINLDMFGGI